MDQEHRNTPQCSAWSQMANLLWLLVSKDDLSLYPLSSHGCLLPVCLCVSALLKMTAVTLV